MVRIPPLCSGDGEGSVKAVGRVFRIGFQKVIQIHAGRASLAVARLTAGMEARNNDKSHQHGMCGSRHGKNLKLSTSL
jgi:hypothetical protein